MCGVGIDLLLGFKLVHHMSYVKSFTPIAAPGARVLILGSMPGQRSLDENQYYAHPQNLFWTLMGQMFNAGPEKSYQQRIERLMVNGIAVWDVLQACYRPGSLDANIDTKSIVANDFETFFSAHPGIIRIFFNGAKAAQVYQKQVVSNLSTGPAHISTSKLPSTSPANASIPKQTKLKAWSEVQTIAKQAE